MTRTGEWVGEVCSIRGMGPTAVTSGEAGGKRESESLGTGVPGGWGGGCAVKTRINLCSRDIKDVGLLTWNFADCAIPCFDPKTR
jgi:hypothetical protein